MPSWSPLMPPDRGECSTMGFILLTASKSRFVTMQRPQSRLGVKISRQTRKSVRPFRRLFSMPHTGFESTNSRSSWTHLLSILNRHYLYSMHTKISRGRAVTQWIIQVCSFPKFQLYFLCHLIWFRGQFCAAVNHCCCCCFCQCCLCPFLRFFSAT